MMISLPPPRKARTRKILVVLSEEEHGPLESLAISRGEPVAAMARTLIVEALKQVEPPSPP